MSAATNAVKPPIEYRASERDLNLESIADAVEERRLADIAARETPEAETPVATPAEPVKVAEQVAKQMRKVKVDGEELEVSEDDLVASFQTRAAASRRLAEANKIKEDAVAEATRIVDEAKAASPAKAPEQTAERKEKIKAYHAALFSGDDETAATLFDDLDMGRQQSIPDASEIIRQVAPEVKRAVKQELDDDSALSKFSTDYKDIVDDPYLVSMTKTELQTLIGEGKPYAEALVSAGNRTRDWLKSKGLSATPPEPTTTTRAEKLEKKDAITQIPSTNSKAASNIEREQTPAEVIAEMRKLRGLD